MSMWRALRRWLIWLVVGEPLPETATSPPPAPTARRERPRVDRQEVEGAGEFYFKGTILDELEAYFRIMGRVKKHDPEAYQLFGKVGMQVVPRAMAFANPHWQPHASGAVPRACVPVEFLGSMPSFGATMVGGEHKGGESVPACLVYFRKVARIDHCRVAPKGWTFYEADTFFDMKLDKRLKGWGQAGENIGFAVPFGVLVGPHGEIEPVKRWMMQPLTLGKRGKGSKGRGRVPFQAPARQPGFGAMLQSWAAENHRPVEEHLRLAFVITVEAALANDASMTRVQVKKGSVVATFGVNIERTPYFFKDRDRVPGANRGGRIFHIVRTHERVLPNGKTRPVRTHFRGLRRFSWNGYEVLITVPGWHHQPLSAFKAGLHIIPEGEPLSTRMVAMGEAADRWAKHIETAEHYR